MATQWRVGAGGAIGLDYGAIPGVCRRIGVSRRAERRAFWALQVMEAAALDWLAEQRKH
jgi:hypothetical protein